MTHTRGFSCCEHAPLGALTTLGVGGTARWLIRVQEPEALADAIRTARDLTGDRPFVLGGGSNLLVADEGFPGAVIQLVGVGTSVVRRGCDVADVFAPADLSWDALVRDVVGRGLQGVECLSGIPGLVGAAPVQNIGAYGQEFADTAVQVDAIDLDSVEPVCFTRADLGFGYRTSRLKREVGRWLVTGIRLRLSPAGSPTVTYRDVVQRLGGVVAPSLATVRQAVLAIRREKSMLSDPTDPNGRSAGSFFVNPVVPTEIGETLVARWPEMPRYPAPAGVKLSAAWLIERSGTQRGERLGSAGISTRHTLALVNADGRATAAEILALAARVRARVRDMFGVELVPEPVLLGFDPGH